MIHSLDEMDFTDIFRTFHPNVEEYIFFSSAHGRFSRINHILGHKSNLSKFKKTEIISSKKLYQASSPTTTLWDYISITRKTAVRNTSTWRVNTRFLNSQQVTEEIKREIKRFLERNDNENMATQTHGMQQKQI